MLKRKTKKKKVEPAAPEAAGTPDPGRAQPAQPTPVPNHPFAPGTDVGFHLTSKVGIERGMAREPFENPFSTAQVQPDGTLAYSYLPKGQWCAVGKMGAGWRYHGFAVK